MSKIANTMTEVPSGLELNEKDYLNVCLSYIKDIEKNMCVAMTEASNEKLFKIFGKMYQEITLLQRECFETAFKYGWYELETESTSKITTKYNKLLDEFNTLNENN